MTKRSMSVNPHPIRIETNGPRSAHTDLHNPLWKKDLMGHFKWSGPWGYRIKRVTNSTEYRPGWCLTKDTVDDLIANGWTVSVLT